jgi:choline-sulfatase
MEDTGTVLLGAALWPLTMKKQPKQPNILLIIDDQHNRRAMGWTGESQCITPSLDRLASQSVCFTDAYTTCPLCVPARHSLYTGRYVADHGVLNNDRPMREGVPTMMSLLNAAGYMTANVGKMHNAPYHLRRDFQYCLHHEFFDRPAGISHYYPFMQQGREKRGLTEDLWFADKPGYGSWLNHPESIAGTHWQPEDMTAEWWTTEQSLTFMRDQLANRPDQPFFLHASYFPPHHPYGPIKKYADWYDPEEIELPPNCSLEKLKAWWSEYDTPHELTEQDAKTMLARYYGFVSQLDAQIGRLLDGLDELGIADNTVVVFVSDHGDMIAEHGRFYKRNMYEGSAGIPFMVRWPGIRARKEKTPVSLIDLVPTILQAADVPVPPEVEGRALQPLLKQTGHWDEGPVFSEHYGDETTYKAIPSSFMIRQGNWKLIAVTPYGQWDEFEYELYDLANDPWELDDCSTKKECKQIFQTLENRLLAFIAERRKKLPKNIPPERPRQYYEISWPADPWTAVKPENKGVENE